MSHGFQITDVIESNNLQGLWILFLYCPEHLPTNTTETVDTNTNCHCISSFVLRVYIMEKDNDQL
jgi:hypothetical protein